MEEKQIEQLLQRYLAGETELAEEDSLRNYFAGGNYPARWAAYAALFAVQAEGPAALTDSEVEEILSQCPPPAGRQIALRTLLRYAAVWACGLLLGGAAVWFLRSPGQRLVAENAAGGEVCLAARDTVYRERIVVERDTVFIVRQLPAPAPRKVAAPGQPSPQPSPRQAEPSPSAPEQLPKAPWSAPSNLASLVAR